MQNFHLHVGWIICFELAHTTASVESAKPELFQTMDPFGRKHWTSFPKTAVWKDRDLAEKYANKHIQGKYVVQGYMWTTSAENQIEAEKKMAKVWKNKDYEDPKTKKITPIND